MSRMSYSFPTIQRLVLDEIEDEILFTSENWAEWLRNELDRTRHKSKGTTESA